MDENKCPICGKPFEPREFNALGTKRIIYVAGCDCKQKAKEAELAEKEKIRLATVEALGAVDDFTVGVFFTNEKKYYSNRFQGAYEIVS